MPKWSRLVRFIPRNTGRVAHPLIGEPVDASLDVGLASLASSTPITVNVFSGSSVLDPGQATGQLAVVERLLSPLAQSEVGAIRCIGTNVSQRLDERVARQVLNSVRFHHQASSTCGGGQPTGSLCPYPIYQA